MFKALMLDDYRRDFTEFHIACAREHYLFHSGQKTALEIAPIYNRYSHLFDLAAIERLTVELDQSSSAFETLQASARRLLAFAVEQFLENSVNHLTEEISQYEATATIEWDGRPITFQDSTVAVTTEPDRDARRSIYARRLEAIEATNDVRSERQLKLHEAARLLGYASYTELFERLRKLDYSSLAEESARGLAQTEETYLTRLSEILKRDLALTIEEAERADALYLLHLMSFNDRFPPGRMLSVYRETMSGLGIEPDSQTNIQIDSESRARKTPRAFCAPISIPSDVRLVIRPVGGQSDYQALFHEAGHAQHYGWSSADLAPEFQYTGDYALTETYAFLFNHLVLDPDWLAAFLGIRDNREVTRSIVLARLSSVRRYAGKLAYERQLHSCDDLAGSSKLYAELQTSATKFKTDAAEFLFDLDDSFYSANYLRAWAFEVLLRDYLKTRFG